MVLVPLELSCPAEAKTSGTNKVFNMPLEQRDATGSLKSHVPSDYVKIAIENDHLVR